MFNMAISDQLKRASIYNFFLFFFKHMLDGNRLSQHLDKHRIDSKTIGTL